MRWRIRLQVRYRRRADLVVAAMAFMVLLVGGLALGQRQATAKTANSVEPVERGFYLSLATFQGNQVRLACAPGYHFASLWEIMDTSNLRYNTSLGRTSDDSGHGPPYGSGWIRTGATSGSGSPGEANCYAWTSASPTPIGTTVSLPSNWTAGEEDLLGWNVGSAICSLQRPVWCVEMSAVYLPLILFS